MFGDCLVQQWLRDRGVINFAVAVSAIANHVDDNIAAKRVPVLKGDAADANHSVDVLGVHMKYRNTLPACQLRSKAR